MPLSVTLTWQPSAGATFYDVYKGGVRVTPAGGITATTFTDTAVVAGGTYVYDVDAGNSSGTSATSGPVTVTLTQVAVPTGLSAVAASSTRVNTAWQAVAGAASYNLFRNGVLVFNTTALSLSDSTVQPQTTYQYQVQAVSPTDAALSSALSAAVSVTTPATPPAVPAPPTGLTATVQ
jgi:fibronectin type 3 domain-containing protein